MKFDLNKAQSGSAVQREVCKGVWEDLNAHFIGYDKDENVVYQNKDDVPMMFEETVVIRTINPKLLRFKPVFKKWWFRTWVFNNGEPFVVSALSLEELDEKINKAQVDSGNWFDKPWSKDIPENGNF